MNKSVHIGITILIMLIVTRFLIRIVDATVQIGNDIGMLLLFAIMVDAVIALISHKLYQRRSRR